MRLMFHAIARGLLLPLRRPSSWLWFGAMWLARGIVAAVVSHDYHAGWGCMVAALLCALVAICLDANRIIDR